MMIVVLILMGVMIAHKKILAAISLFGFFGFFHVIEIFGKSTVEQLPPPQFMLRTEHLMDFPQFHIRQEYSYPSGHSGRAFLLSTVLIIMIWQNRRLSPLVKTVLIGGLIAYDIIMLVTRVYLGEHWLTDVLGGALLGVAFGLIIGTFLLDKKTTLVEHAKKGKGLLPKFKVKIERVD